MNTTRRGQTATPAQISALAFIDTVPGKSGGFYADFGHRPQTLNAMWKVNLIEVLRDEQVNFRIIRARWQLTDKGRAALRKATEG